MAQAKAQSDQQQAMVKAEAERQKADLAREKQQHDMMASMATLRMDHERQRAEAAAELNRMQRENASDRLQAHLAVEKTRVEIEKIRAEIERIGAQAKAAAQKPAPKEAA
jgi:hypothetical protein